MIWYYQCRVMNYLYSFFNEQIWCLILVSATLRTILIVTSRGTLNDGHVCIHLPSSRRYLRPPVFGHFNAIRTVQLHSNMFRNLEDLGDTFNGDIYMNEPSNFIGIVADMSLNVGHCLEKSLIFCYLSAQPWFDYGMFVWNTVQVP